MPEPAPAKPATPKPHFTAAQLERAKLLDVPPSHDVLDPTDSTLHGHGLPTSVKDEATAVAYAKKNQVQVPIPGDAQSRWARCDGSVGEYQRP